MREFLQGDENRGGEVVWTSQLFGGKILADVRLPGNRGVAVVYPGSFAPEEGRRAGTPSVEKVPAPEAPPRVSFRRYLAPAGGDVDITRQEILVSVGRGIQNRDNLELAEELARVLGGWSAPPDPSWARGGCP